MDNALGAKAAYRSVERRLIDAGAVVELEQLHGMSSDETDLLIKQERGLWQRGDQ